MAEPRPTTTYYAVPMVRESDQDWGSDLNRILGELTRLLAVNQKPVSISIRWGDITAGRYLECNANGLQLRGNVNYSHGMARNFVFERGTEFPATFATGQVFYRSDEDVLYLRQPDGWVPFALVTEESVREVGGIVLQDFGADATDIGSIPVFNDTPGGMVVGRIRPAEYQGQLMLANAEAALGWEFKTPAQALAQEFPSRGAFFIGSNEGEGVLVEQPEEDLENRIFVADPTEPGGVRWATPMEVTGTVYEAPGELVVGSGAGEAVRVAPPASSGEVLIADANEPGGIRWAPQAELGSVPGISTTNGANLFAVNNYF